MLAVGKKPRYLRRIAIFTSMANLTLHRGEKTYNYQKIQVLLDPETVDILNRFCRLVKRTRSGYIADLLKATSVGLVKHVQSLEELQLLSDPVEMHRKMESLSGVLNDALEVAKDEV